MADSFTPENDSFVEDSFTPDEKPQETIGQRARKNLTRSAKQFALSTISAPLAVMSPGMGTLSDLPEIWKDPTGYAKSIPDRLINAVTALPKSVLQTISHPQESFAEDPVGTTAMAAQALAGGAGLARGAARFTRSPGGMPILMGLGEVGSGIGGIVHGTPESVMGGAYLGARGVQNILKGVETRKAAVPTGRSAGTTIPLLQAPPSTPEPSPWTGKAIPLPASRPKMPEPSQWSGKSVPLPASPATIPEPSQWTGKTVPLPAGRPPTPEPSAWTGKAVPLPLSRPIPAELSPWSGKSVPLPATPSPIPEPSQWSGKAIPLPSAPPSTPPQSQWTGRSVPLPSRVTIPTAEAPPPAPQGTSSTLPPRVVIPEGTPTRQRIKPSEGSHLDLSTETPTARDYRASARNLWGSHMDRAFRMRNYDAEALGGMTQAQVDAIAKEIGVAPSSPEKLAILMEKLRKNPGGSQ